MTFYQPASFVPPYHQPPISSKLYPEPQSVLKSTNSVDRKIGLIVSMTDKNLETMHKSLSVGSIQSYLDWINRLPMLTLEEEQDFAKRNKYHQDLDAARQLVLSHLRLVAKIARGYSGYGLSHSDLIQEGNLGLMKAVKRFDPDVGVRLVSFAVHWIRAEIQEFVLRNWRIVRVATTKAQRKLFFKLRGFSKDKNWLSQDEIKAIAEVLNVKEDEVALMEQRLTGQDVAFHSENNDDSDNFHVSPERFLESADGDPALLLEHKTTQQSVLQGLHDALSRLDERSQHILRERWLKGTDKATLHELADIYDISAERVRQLEKQAMKKIKAALMDETA